MGIPTRRMKLLAFAIGAGIAALAGATDAAFQGNVVPNPRYSALTLINLYAMVVLGGTGSLPGAIIGSFIFTVLPEVLRSVQLAGLLFYGLGVAGLWRILRPFSHFLTVLGGTIVAGGVFKLLVGLLAPQWDTACSTLEAACPQAGSVLNSIIQGWLVIPENFQLVGNVATVLAVALLLGFMLVNGRWRWLLLGLTIYLFAFSWETRLAVEPAATRILIIGTTLVVLMITRPQGILGKAEVKII
jgi:ABC-type branched-subunit amino acid transport system permease subunit